MLKVETLKQIYEIKVITSNWSLDSKRNGSGVRLFYLSLYYVFNSKHFYY